jgi:hypothetical protein
VAFLPRAEKAPARPQGSSLRGGQRPGGFRPPRPDTQRDRKRGGGRPTRHRPAPGACTAGGCIGRGGRAAEAKRGRRWSVKHPPADPKETPRHGSRLFREEKGGQKPYRPP